MHLSKTRTRVFFVFMALFLGFLGAGLFRPESLTVEKKELLTKDSLATILASSVRENEFPKEMNWNISGKSIQGIPQYSFDSKLQGEMEKQFAAYRPDYGAFVALDPVSGKILSMVSVVRGQKTRENLTIKASFPSASVFKVVTAAAAIESKRFSPDTVIPYNGRNHTLYRVNILKDKITRWTRYITLKEAFGRSINTVFGKIGAFGVGSAELRQYADRFGFNRTIASDIPIQPGSALIPDDAWGLAESASGFTRENTMSPLQGALIAGTIANDGTMMEPYVVQSVRGLNGNSIYDARPERVGAVVDPQTAEEIRDLMRQTVRRGTSRSAFRGFFKGQYAQMDVGGKTGSLTGLEPKGKYDWFIGYAKEGQTQIAIAVLTINRDLWRVKSSTLARRAIEVFFKPRGAHDLKGT